MIRRPNRRSGPVSLLLVLVLLLVTGCSASTEQGRYSLTLVTEQEHVVGAGESLVGDTVVAGGTLTLAEGAEHRGTVTVLAGEFRADGRVAGDLTVMGGNAILHESAEVTGDLAVVGGDLTRHPAAVVRGSIVDGPGPATILEQGREAGSLGEGLLWSLGLVVVMALLAWLAASLLPRPVQRIEDAATGFPVVSAALGALVLITALPLLVSMVFTLVLIPLAGGLLVALSLSAALGVIATGHRVGTLVLRRFGAQWKMGPTAAMGTAVLLALLQLIGRIPLVGAVVVVATLVVCIGAFFLAGFGLRSYIPPQDWDDSSHDDEALEPT